MIVLSFPPERSEARKRQEACTHCMRVTVRQRRFVTSRLVAAIGRGPVVHEPVETQTSREKSSERVKNVWESSSEFAWSILTEELTAGNT